MSCRFVVISDTHFNRPPSPDGGTWWNRTTESRSEEMGTALIECVKRLAPDFIIHCGDFVGTDSAENFEFGRAIMEQTGCPWYAVPGNHDAWTMDARNGFSDVFCMKDGSWSYSLERGGLRFFFLDVVWWLEDNGVVSPVLDRKKYDTGHIVGMGPTVRDTIRLENELRESTLPSILVTHAPVYFRDAYPCRTLPYGRPAKGPLTPPEGFVSGFLTAREGRTRLHEIVRNSGKIAVCFAGHWHLHDAVESEGVWYLQTAALREYPYEVRLVEYDGSSFGITTHELDIPELRDLSYVKEWGNDWICGEKSVRNFRFPLKGHKWNIPSR